MSLGFMIMRLVHKEVYGYVSVQVALYMSLSMFFAKEAVRRAALRNFDDNRETQSAFNLVQLMLPINLLILLVATLYLVFLSRPSGELEYFVPSILCWAAALAIESYLEAYYVYTSLSKDLSPRLKLESIGILVKTVLNYGMLFLGFHLQT
jgi:peptidoglycan biosynthesis protein MviN/MurJ (putative lipid II flippase)